MLTLKRTIDNKISGNEKEDIDSNFPSYSHQLYQNSINSQMIDIYHVLQSGIDTVVMKYNHQHGRDTQQFNIGASLARNIF